MGIDISKRTFDVALSLNVSNATVTKKQLVNNLKGFEQLQSWLQHQNAAITEVFFCMENTGLYHLLLVSWLQQQGGFVWVEMPVQIKWSMGVQRGKSDPADAARICLYAFRNADKAENYTSIQKAVQQISCRFGKGYFNA